MKLLPDEKIIVECRHHWTIFLMPCFLIAFTMYFYSLDSLLGLFAFVFGILAMASYGYAVKKFLAYRYILTTHRLIIVSGLSSRTDVYLNKIESINTNGFLLWQKVGNVTITCSGGTIYRYKTLKNPHLLGQQLLILNKANSNS